MACGMGDRFNRPHIIGPMLLVAARLSKNGVSGINPGKYTQSEFGACLVCLQWRQTKRQIAGMAPGSFELKTPTEGALQTGNIRGKKRGDISMEAQRAALRACL
jgi:hypothetical protein